MGEEDPRDGRSSFLQNLVQATRAVVRRRPEEGAERLAGYDRIYAAAVVLALFVVPLSWLWPGFGRRSATEVVIHLIVGSFTLLLVYLNGRYWDQMEAFFGDEGPSGWPNPYPHPTDSPDGGASDRSRSRELLGEIFAWGPLVSVLLYVGLVATPSLAGDLLACADPPCLGASAEPVAWPTWVLLGGGPTLVWTFLVLVGFTFLFCYARRWLEMARRVSEFEAAQAPPTSSGALDWERWWAGRRRNALALRRVSRTWLLGWAVAVLTFTIAGVGRLAIAFYAIQPRWSDVMVVSAAGTLWLVVLLSLLAGPYPQVRAAERRMRERVEDCREEVLRARTEAPAGPDRDPTGTLWMERPPGTDVTRWRDVLALGAGSAISLLSAVPSQLFELFFALLG